MNGNMFAGTSWWEDQQRKWAWLEDVPMNVRKWYIENNRTPGRKCADCKFFSNLNGKVMLCALFYNTYQDDRNWPKTRQACGKWDNVVTPAPEQGAFDAL